MSTYTTKQGDMWDSIAYEKLGSVDFVGQLLTMNAKYAEYYVLPAGIVLDLPDTRDISPASTMPPWKQVGG